MVSKANLYLTITFSILLIIPAGVMLISNNLLGTNKIAYAQANQMSSNITNSLNIEGIPVKKVHVGDIDIAYKTIGKGEPFVLINGASSLMDDWNPSILRDLSSNHTVIISDYRGAGNTTTGTKPFSIQQFANDTAGLLDALKIQRADVLGYSLGSFVAQQLTVTHPEKVNRLLLIAASCGGKESIPPSPQVVKFQTGLVNKFVNNIPITPQELKTLVSLPFGSAWLKLHPNYLVTIPPNTQLKDIIRIPIYAQQQQLYSSENWTATSWSGICDELAKISNPTLVITGTDDNYIPSANSLIIAGKIPGAWLVQVKDAGHAVSTQYPDKLDKVIQTFLSTTTSPG